MKQSKLKVLSWNVHYPYFAQDNIYVVDMLEALGNVDVICLQEYVDGASEQTKEWLESHDFIISYLPFASKGDLSQGVMTAVRKGLTSQTKSIVLRKDAPKTFRPFHNIRGILATTITTESGPVTIFNSHLTPPRPQTIDLRKREFSQLKQFLNNNPPEQNWFLCGDFNFLAYDSRKNYLARKYQGFTGSLLHKTWRHHHRYTPIRGNLDYFFWSGNNIDVSAKLLGFNHSDHRPMLANIYLQ